MEPRGRALVGASAGYLAMVAATVAGFLLIRRWGGSLVAPSASGAAGRPHAGADSGDLLHVLIALAAVVMAGQLLARLCARVGQPRVIGEVLGGIVLGPSLLGPHFSSLVLPPSIAPTLAVIAQLGVILYMFLVGLELNTELLRRRVHLAFTISHASILLPFLLGAALALWLYPMLGTRNVPFVHFALFLGVAMSVTAFPVLARILTDHGLSRTDLGVLALGCAAVDDVTAWSLLAFVAGLAGARPGEGLRVAGWGGAYVAVMLVVVRPLLGRLASRWNTEQLPRSVVALVFAALLLSSMATEAAGIHAVFGAFFLGALIPHESAVARVFARQLDSIVTVLLLPAFFAFTGMRTRIDLVTGWEQWLICGVIVAVATAGKFGGTVAASRLAGLSWRHAASLGVLLNARGLMELIVLNVGLDLGVISPLLFSMMVLMALATTLSTAPLLRLLNNSGTDYSITNS